MCSILGFLILERPSTDTSFPWSIFINIDSETPRKLKHILWSKEFLKKMYGMEIWRHETNFRLRQSILSSLPFIFSVHRQSRFEIHPIMPLKCKIHWQDDEREFCSGKLEINILECLLGLPFEVSHSSSFYFRGDSVRARKIYPRKVVNADNENCNFL